jgi:alpha-galactosidase
MQEDLRKYAGPGHWNDPDMLEVGNGALTPGEDRAHFTMWAMIAAPLIAGNDLRSMSQHTKDILINKDVIAINQDSLGIQALKYTTKDSVETWLKPLKNGDWAICFLNRSTLPKTVEFDWQSKVIRDDVANRTLDGRAIYKLRDLWNKKEIGDTKKDLKITVPARDVTLYRMIRE